MSTHPQKGFAPPREGGIPITNAGANPMVENVLKEAAIVATINTIPAVTIILPSGKYSERCFFFRLSGKDSSMGVHTVGPFIKGDETGGKGLGFDLSVHPRKKDDLFLPRPA